jgi:molybdopterin/thiamine biosynthesis adenylyltransferase/rhodanese-related sulfurtransferase
MSTSGESESIDVKSLDVKSMHRYSRHITIDQVGESGQLKLSNARVLVVGAGGLGSPALLYLAAAGVGTLGIIEFDTIELSNLQRQIIHGESGLGMSKARSAATRITELNSAIAVEVFDMPIGRDNALEVVGSFDLVVDGSDNFATRYLLNDACVISGKPYIWGSVLRFDGQVSVFGLPGGPCYRCVYPTPPESGSVPNCADAGVFGAVCGVIGSLQVSEALKIIIGMGEVLSGRIAIFDALSASIEQVVVTRDRNCPVCGDSPTITELRDYVSFCAGGVSQESITRIQLVEMLRERERGETSFTLIDIREEYELFHGSIPGAVNLPLSTFDPEVCSGNIVLYCQAGVRSEYLLRELTSQGIPGLKHYAGGYIDWLSGR